MPKMRFFNNFLIECISEKSCFVVLVGKVAQKGEVLQVLSRINAWNFPDFLHEATVASRFEIVLNDTFWEKLCFEVFGPKVMKYGRIQLWTGELSFKYGRENSCCELARLVH